MKNLFFNGAEQMKIENGKYYIANEETNWDYMKECTRNEFIHELREISWVCLTSWDKKVRQDYLDLVDYTNNMR